MEERVGEIGMASRLLHCPRRATTLSQTPHNDNVVNCVAKTLNKNNNNNNNNNIYTM
jgi:hypothetical protein